MARTLTITDDELGATASVRVEDLNGASMVTHLHFDAQPGRGISAETLRMIEDLGLQLPASTPAVPGRRSPRKAAADKPAKPRKRATRAAKPAPAGPAVHPNGGNTAQLGLPGVPAAIAAAPQFTEPGPAPARPAPGQRKVRRAGGPPAHGDLVALFHRHHGDIAAMAAELDAAQSTVGTWLRNAREAGVRITLDAPAAP